MNRDQEHAAFASRWGKVEGVVPSPQAYVDYGRNYEAWRRRPWWRRALDKLRGRNKRPPLHPLDARPPEHINCRCTIRMPITVPPSKPSDES